ncbi:autotransporter domain-containing protein [Citromicrobium bathyomarinum]|uniref:autotransporter domain-containing protein n=1 Tax=Citromicrobium bathyomarinum TaxID=72174 RepID=UPI00315AF236
MSTQGKDSAAVLVSAPGQIAANLGLVSTDGDNSPGVTLITDPAICAVLGAGACGGTVAGPGGPGGGGDGPDIDTDGDDSPGVDIDSPGPIDVEVDDVDTDGDNSPGIDVDGGEGDIDIDFGDIDTDGDNSPGVEVDGTGSIDVDGDSVQTDGASSPGIDIDGDDDPVTVDVGMVMTTGPDSDGINVDTTTGPITIVTGPVMVTGPGSDGIDVTATECTTVSVTANGDVSSAQGTGIDAESGCDLIITTAPGADVSGAIAGIEATSGTGSTITLGGDVSSTTGPALDADGAAATVRIGATGSITGRIDLTDNDDLLTNNGRFNATQSSDFGAGNDTLANSGTIAVAGTQTFAGLETLANNGVIDMRDGATDDSLTIPGDYSGGGTAFLGVDVGPGSASDRLNIGGAATGSTSVVFDAGGNFVNGAIVVDAGAGTDASAFTLNAVQDPLVDYTLQFDAANGDFLAFGTPSAFAASAVLVAEGARQILYRNNEAVGSHLASLGVGAAGGTTENPRIGSALWVNFSGNVQNRENAFTASPFGVARTYDLSHSQDFFGVQGGADLFGGANSVVGVTVGYASSDLRTDTTLSRIDYESINFGVYGMASFGPAYVAGLAKYEMMNVEYGRRSGPTFADVDGEGWGGWIEVGARFGNSFFFQPAVSLEYATVDIDDFTQGVTDFALEEDDGLRGKAGVRIGTNVGTDLAPAEFYATAQVIHEFQGEDTITLSNVGGTVSFVSPAIDTHGRAGAGFRARMRNGVSGFIEGTVDFGDGVSGGTVRGGVRVPL